MQSVSLVQFLAVLAVQSNKLSNGLSSGVRPSVGNLQNELLLKNKHWDFDGTSCVAFWYGPLSSLLKSSQSDH